MKTKFKMSLMEELTHFLGLQIKQMYDGNFINQEKYCLNMLKKFRMIYYKSLRTPMSPSTKVSEDESRKLVDEKLYRSMIGSLLYLITSKLDICFSVCACVRFQSKLKESHSIAVKRILRYMKGTIKHGLYYSHNSKLNLNAYYDADYGGFSIDKKTTNGAC
jgi:hypothetical protein